MQPCGAHWHSGWGGGYIYGLSSCMDWCCITVSLYALCLFLFTACNSCKEGEVCSVVGESNGARYPICKGPTTGRHNTFIIYFEVWFYIVPCSGGSGEPHFSACPEDYRCVTHNTTNIRYCLQSCYLENGGCPPEQVCYYERKDEDCNQLMEPCFKTACTDVPGKQCTIALMSQLGWIEHIVNVSYLLTAVTHSRGTAFLTGVVSLLFNKFTLQCNFVSSSICMQS